MLIKNHYKNAFLKSVQKTEEYKENKPREYDPVVEQLIATDLKALQEINPEVVGWVYIPETEIDYPVLQHEIGRASCRERV